MRIGNPHTQPVPVATARPAQAPADPHPASGLLYQVLSALAWNG